jgi:hypothetical protein
LEQRLALETQGETVGRARFLLVRNIGTRLERMEVRDGHGALVASTGAIDSGESTVICVSYEGKAGNSSRVSDPQSMDLFKIRDGASSRRVAIPRPPADNELRGAAAECRIGYGYPEGG